MPEGRSSSVFIYLHIPDNSFKLCEVFMLHIVCTMECLICSSITLHQICSSYCTSYSYWIFFMTENSSYYNGDCSEVSRRMVWCHQCMVNQLVPCHVTSSIYTIFSYKPLSDTREQSIPLHYIHQPCVIQFTFCCFWVCPTQLWDWVPHNIVVLLLPMVMPSLTSDWQSGVPSL